MTEANEPLQVEQPEQTPEPEAAPESAQDETAELLSELQRLGVQEPQQLQNMAQASQKLGCTTSQLVKLLAKHSGALMRVNHQRQELGLRKLKG
jgi:hypothetical protein